MQYLKRTLLFIALAISALFIAACSLTDDIKNIKTKLHFDSTSSGASAIVYFEDEKDLMFNNYSISPVARIYFKEMLKDDNGKDRPNPVTFRQESMTKNRREGNVTITDVVKFKDLYYLKEKDTDPEIKKYALKKDYNLVLRILLRMEDNSYFTLAEKEFAIHQDAAVEEQAISSKADLDYYFYSDKKESISDLLDFSKQKVYNLEQDLDLEGMEISSLTGRDDFLSTFDGKGHTISNFKLKVTSSDTYVGLFAKNFGTIRNLTLKDVTLVYKDYPTNNSVGFFAGTNNGVIENCTLENATIDYHQTDTSDDHHQYIGFFAGSMQLFSDKFDIKLVQNKLGFRGNTVINSKMNIQLLDPRNVFIGGAIGYIGNQRTNLSLDYIIEKNYVADNVVINLDHNVKKQDSAKMNLTIGGFAGFVNHDFSDIYVGATLNLKATYDLEKKDDTKKPDPFPTEPTKEENLEDLKPSINNGLDTYTVYTAGVVAYVGEFVSTISDVAFVGKINSTFDHAYKVYSSLIFGFVETPHTGDVLNLKNVQIDPKGASDLFTLTGNPNHKLQQDLAAAGVKVIDPITTVIAYGALIGSADESLKINEKSLNANLVYDFDNKASVVGNVSSKAEYTKYKSSAAPNTALFSTWLKTQLNIK